MVTGIVVRLASLAHHALSEAEGQVEGRTRVIGLEGRRTTTVLHPRVVRPRGLTPPRQRRGRSLSLFECARLPPLSFLRES